MTRSTLSRVLELWQSPRYSRLRLHMDPQTRQIMAETEEEPLPEKKFPLRAILYTLLILGSVAAVFYYLYNQSHSIERDSISTKTKIDALYEQHQTLLRQSKEQSEAFTKELNLAREQLALLQTENKQLTQAASEQTQNLQDKIDLLQRENQALIKKINDLEADLSTAQSPPPPPRLSVQAATTAAQNNTATSTGDPIIEVILGESGNP